MMKGGLEKGPNRPHFGNVSSIKGHQPGKRAVMPGLRDFLCVLRRQHLSLVLRRWPPLDYCFSLTTGLILHVLRL